MTESTMVAPKPSTVSTTGGTEAGANAATAVSEGDNSNGGTSATESNQNNDANAGTDEITCQSNNKDIEKGSNNARSRSRSRRKHRPLLRRLFHYIQTTWIGGRFNPKQGK